MSFTCVHTQMKTYEIGKFLSHCSSSSATQYIYRTHKLDILIVCVCVCYTIRERAIFTHFQQRALKFVRHFQLTAISWYREINSRKILKCLKFVSILYLFFVRIFQACVCVYRCTSRNTYRHSDLKLSVWLCVVDFNVKMLTYGSQNCTTIAAAATVTVTVLLFWYAMDNSVYLFIYGCNNNLE